MTDPLRLLHIEILIIHSVISLRIRKPDPSAAAKPGETFLSSDVITGILSESKLALKRCEAVSGYRTSCLGLL